MTWATPLIAGIAAAVAIPLLVLLYFLKLRRREIEVSTTLLWKKAIQDLQANAPFQKLRRNILLLLQLLMLAAVLLAIAQPEKATTSGIGQRNIILLDRSASMGATDVEGDGSRSRLDEAKAQALDLVNSMREPGVLDRGDDAADQAMVIAFDTTAEIVAQLTSDKNVLRRAIESVKVTDAPSRVKEAFRLAQAQRPERFVEGEGLNRGPPFSFHLYSDGRLPDADEAIPSVEDKVLFHVIGSPTANNVAITALRAERAYDNPAQLSIFVGVQSTDSVRRTVDCELALDGRTVAVREVTIPAASIDPAGDETEGQRRPGEGGVVFELDMPDGAIARVRLDTGSSTNPAADVLAVDDQGWLVVPPARQTSVAIVTDGNLFLADALAGMPLARLDIFKPSEFQTARAAGRADIYDVVVLDSWLPQVAPPASLPPGRWLVLGAVPQGPDGLIDKGGGGPAQILVWSRSHPAMRDLTLDALTIIESRNVELPEGSGAITLAETAQGPAIVELPAPDSRAIVVPFDVMNTNWPFNASFVLFLAQAIDYLDRDAADAAAASGAGRLFRPGDVLTDRLPPGVTNVRVDPPSPQPEQELVPAPDGRIAFGPIRGVGVYRLRWTGAAGATDQRDGQRVTRHFAANLTDPDESNVTAATQITLGTETKSAEQSGADEAVKRYWPYLLMVALGVLMVEWWIYNRKVAV
ncbi:MAG: VWA domain-containing protein [Phycisphaerales bacterium]